MVNSEELIGTTEYMTLYTKYRINRCRYNRVRLYIGTYMKKGNSGETLKAIVVMADKFGLGNPR
jgi:hypothetical protein